MYVEATAEDPPTRAFCSSRPLVTGVRLAGAGRLNRWLDAIDAAAAEPCARVTELNPPVTLRREGDTDRLNLSGARDLVLDAPGRATRLLIEDRLMDDEGREKLRRLPTDDELERVANDDRLRETGDRRAIEEGPRENDEARDLDA